MLKYEQLTPGTDSDFKSMKHYCVEFRQQRMAAGLSDNEGLSFLSHLIKDIKSRETGDRATRVPASLASHTSLHPRLVTFGECCKHNLLPGSHLSFYRVMLWTRGGQVLVLLIKLRSSLADVACPCVTQSWKYDGGTF